MPHTIESSVKAGIVRRAKALAVLLLPLLVFAAVVFLASSVQRRLDAWRESQVPQPSSEQSMTVEKVPGPQVSGSTSVTTYIVTGKY